jgi:hypothetical protein
MSETVDPREEKIRLVAQVENRHRQPDLCTIYEPHSDELQQMSTWITAKEGAFLDLESIR